MSTVISAPKGLTWPKFRSWYTKNIGDNKVSNGWINYKKKNGMKSSPIRKSSVTRQRRPVDQDDWDNMGNALDMIGSALKTKTKPKTSLPRTTPLKKKTSSNKNTRISPSLYSEQEKKNFFKKGSKLTEGQKKYCRCVLEVEHVANPWATCAGSTHNSYRDCGQEYNWYTLPSQALRNYARNSRIEINKNDTDDQVRMKINKWKQKKYGER